MAISKAPVDVPSEVGQSLVEQGLRDFLVVLRLHRHVRLEVEAVGEVDANGIAMGLVLLLPHHAMPAGPEQDGVARLDRRLWVCWLARAIPELDPAGLEDFLNRPPRTGAAAVTLRFATDRVAVEGGRAGGTHCEEKAQHKLPSHLGTECVPDHRFKQPSSLGHIHLWLCMRMLATPARDRSRFACARRRRGRRFPP
jgi:hypothetical protein